MIRTVIINDYKFMKNFPEVWVNIRGFPGYKLSNSGLVKSFRKSSFGKIMKPILSSSGYYYITLFRRKHRTHKFIHRMLAEEFIPNSQNKPEVNHKDGVKTNNSLSNLEWVTRSENAKHAHLLGLSRSPRMLGKLNKATKLSEEDVVDIRRLYSNMDISLSRLGDLYGVSENAVKSIITRRTWNYIR